MTKYYPSSEIAKIISPAPVSNFMQKLQDAKENIYASKRAPIGKCPPHDIPARYRDASFGIASGKSESIEKVIYSLPCLATKSQYSEDFKPLERQPFEDDLIHCFTQRLNVSSRRKDRSVFTLHHGENRKKIVQVPWRPEKMVGPESDSIHTIHIPKTFILKKDPSSPHTDPIKIKPMNFAKESQLMEKLWTILKMKNHLNFNNFISAFKEYDQNNKGEISIDDLKAMCKKFGILAPEETIEKLFTECDLNEDGVITYKEFIHMLNWKDTLPEKSNIKIKNYANEWHPLLSEDAINHYKTTSSIIGEHNISVSSKTAGIPSIRTDLKKPIFRNFSDDTVYEETKVSDVIQPNLFAKYGIFNDELSLLRSKEEIKALFANSGIIVNESFFEKIWQYTSQDDQASIEAIWKNLKQCLFHNK